ncbi:outer membrane beta-barrel protein [Methylacidimicrobium cyclopophantes]|uniref:outer membrane beta-barrel protein n=1 Tax=Methylacidimicrobium cyclopophantes TaxID=1041766 RepID=UPI001FEC9B6B|nr:outer membrane beta-barrel protein [Methylacidimicrobium cyclopophantes]
MRSLRLGYWRIRYGREFERGGCGGRPVRLVLVIGCALLWAVGDFQPLFGFSGEGGESDLTASTNPTEEGERKRLLQLLEEQGMAVSSSSPAVRLGGYVDSAFEMNFINAPSFNRVPRFVAPTAGGGSRLARGYPLLPMRLADDGIPGGGFNLNQLKLWSEKALTAENRWDAGFRMDLMLAQDAALGVPDFLAGAGTSTSSGLGFNTSEVFLEQAYAQFQIPIGDRKLEVHVGKFAAPIGLEVLERPANFNMTYGLFFNNVEPFVLVGTQFLFRVDDQWTVRGGITDGGFNTGRGGYPFFGMVDNSVSGLSNFLLTFNVDYISPDKSFVSTYGMLYGPHGTNPPGFGTSPGMVNGIFYPGAYAAGDIVSGPYNSPGTYMEFNDYGIWTPSFVYRKRLQLAYELIGGFYNNAVAPAGITGLGPATETALGIFPLFPYSFGYGGPTNWMGAALYQIYRFNPLVSLALREQWLQASWNSYLEGMIAPTNIYSTTITLRFDLADNFMVRMEYRMDWGNNMMNYYAPADGVPPAEVGLSGNGLVGSSSGPFFFAGLEAVYTF